jgi:hypothetical protein
LAIIAAIGLHNVKNITENFKQVTDNLARTVTVTNENADEKSVQRQLHEVINGPNDTGQRFNEMMENMSKKITPSLILIPTLVLFCLLVLIFTAGNSRIEINVEKNLIISMVLSIIFILSIYTIYELVELFTTVFNIRYRTRNNN